MVTTVLFVVGVFVAVLAVTWVVIGGVKWIGVFVVEVTIMFIILVDAVDGGVKWIGVLVVEVTKILIILVVSKVELCSIARILDCEGDSSMKNG